VYQIFVAPFCCFDVVGGVVAMDDFIDFWHEVINIRHEVKKSRVSSACTV